MQQLSRFVPRKLLYSLSMILTICSYFGYFFLRSSNIGEYGQNFYRSVSISNTLIDYFITVWKMPKIFQFIEMCEKFIENSKQRTLIDFLKKK